MIYLITEVRRKRANDRHKKNCTDINVSLVVFLLSLKIRASIVCVVHFN